MNKIENIKTLPHSRHWISFTLSMMLSACGGGGESNPSLAPSKQTEASQATPSPHEFKVMLGDSNIIDSGISSHGMIRLSFDKNMAISTQNANAIQLIDPDNGGILPAHIITPTADGRNIIVLPMKPLLSGKQYQIRIGTSVATQDNQRLTQAASLAFKTLAADQDQPIGLANLGASCFINAALQLIVNQPSLRLGKV